MTLTEKYFRAIGWTPPAINRKYWSRTQAYEGGAVSELPDITQSFADFKLHVLEKMEGEGLRPVISLGVWGWWYHPREILKDQIEEPIKDNEILTAGVISATKYFKGKK